MGKCLSNRTRISFLAHVLSAWSKTSLRMSEVVTQPTPLSGRPVSTSSVLMAHIYYIRTIVIDIGSLSLSLDLIQSDTSHAAGQCPHVW